MKSKHKLLISVSILLIIVEILWRTTGFKGFVDTFWVCVAYYTILSISNWLFPNLPKTKEQKIWDAIEYLRNEEADSVTILCDNPDFNGLPNCAIDCCGDWTGWKDKRFAADTVLECLQMAVKEKRKYNEI